MNHLLLTAFGILLSAQIKVSAQQAVLAAGKDVSGNGSVSFSIGQVVYTANAVNPISVTQGVQQTYDKDLSSGSNESSPTRINIFPNPTTERLIVQFQESCENCSFELMDESGKLLQHGNASGIETNIFVNQLVAGTYFLRILKNTTEIETAKIVKSN